MRKVIMIFLLLMSLSGLNAQQSKTTKSSPVQKTTVSQGRLVEITTEYGTMVVKLYDSTPLHRDNFITLVKQGFYDSLLFHRVIQGFMIQGGDPQSKTADSSALLGSGEAPGGMIPAEFKPNLYHKKGALAMARSDNPEKASSNCQFYIVEGQVFDEATLNQVECGLRQTNLLFSFSDTQRKIYTTVGGTPQLDQNYTVFGEVIKGVDIVDKIAAVAKDENDRPVKNVRMKMRMLN